MTINYTTPAPLDARLRAAFRARYNWTGADKDLDAFILQCHKDFTKSVLQSAETDEAQRAAVATKRAEIEGLF